VASLLTVSLIDPGVRVLIVSLTRLFAGSGRASQAVCSPATKGPVWGLRAWGPGGRGGAAAGVGQARGCRVPPLGSAARTELRILKAAHSAAQVRNSPVAKSAFYSLPTDAAHSQHDTPPRRASESVR